MTEDGPNQQETRRKRRLLRAAGLLAAVVILLGAGIYGDCLPADTLTVYGSQKGNAPAAISEEERRPRR